MAMRDLIHNLHAWPSVPDGGSPVAYEAYHQFVADAKGDVIDLANYDSCMFIVGGENGSSALRVSIEESDDETTFRDAVPGDVQAPDGVDYATATVSGTVHHGVAVAASQTDTFIVLGYVGNARYVRVAVDGAGAAGADGDIGDAGRMAMIALAGTRRRLPLNSQG
jgi:hypothetical protein